MAKGKYKDWLTDEGLLKIKQWARLGLTEEQIAKNTGISYRTFSNWKNRFNEINITLKDGRKPILIETKPKKRIPARGRKDTPEFKLEQKFKDRVEELGGVAYKLTIASHNGIPDRMVTFPGGYIGFVEVKRPDGKGYLRPNQRKEIALLKEQGQRVFILDSYEDIDNVINAIRGG